MHGKIWGDIMKNSKGFTVVELLVSFSLTMIIAVFLFEVLIEVKDIFADAATRTAIQEKASIISKNIDNILAANDNRITCNNSTNLGNCQINGKSFRINKENNQIIVDGQKFDMPETVSIKNYSIQDSCDGNNCYLHVQMTLESGNLTKDYDYDVTYYFTANPTEIPGATFKESGTNPKIVTITYPEGCGTTYTCTYQKNNEQQITVTSQIANVNFNESGNILATVSDGINNATETYNVDVPQDSLSVTLSNTHTTNSITAIANVTSVSRVTKYEFSIDGQKWQESNINTYEFTGLKNNTEYTIMTRITNATGKTATASQKVTTSDIPIPTFTQSGVYPLTVKITFPEGCGSTYTCTYTKNNGTAVNVTTTTVDVTFNLADVNDNYQGSVAATVSDGTNTQSPAAHTVKIQLKAADLSYTNTATGLDCTDAQCALDAIKRMLE